MKVSCEINWIDEDDSIDEVIKDAIVGQVVTKVSNQLYNKIEREASEKLSNRVDELLTKMVDRFMNKEIVVTDNWGDIIEKHESVDELMKSKFDKFMTQKVNKEGKSTDSCSYGDKYTRVTFLIDNRIKDHANRITKEIALEMDKKLKEKLESIKTEVGKKIAEKLEL